MIGSQIIEQNQLPRALSEPTETFPHLGLWNTIMRDFTVILLFFKLKK